MKINSKLYRKYTMVLCKRQDNTLLILIIIIVVVVWHKYKGIDQCAVDIVASVSQGGNT